VSIEMAGCAQVTAGLAGIAALIGLFIPLLTTACAYSETGCYVSPYQLVSVVNQGNNFPIAGPAVVCLFFYLVAVLSIASNVLVCMDWTFARPHRVVYARILYIGNAICAIGACISAGITFSGSTYAGLGLQQASGVDPESPRLTSYSIIVQVFIAIVSIGFTIWLRPKLQTLPVQMPSAELSSTATK